jgi:hypothetical protein
MYRGRCIADWDMTVCDVCLRANAEGVLPSNYPHLVPHLRKLGIPINASGAGAIAWPMT